MDILVYALIAIVLAWRLFSVLGTRHENDRQRPNPFAQSSNPSTPDKDLLALPLTAPTPVPAKQPAPLAAFAPAPESLSGVLYALRKAEPGFDEKSFVKGARLAFERVVKAYAAGDRTDLQPLVSPVLFEAFENAIAAREQAGEKLELKVFTVSEAHIDAARLKGRYAYITVEFASDQQRLTTTSAGTQDDSLQHLHDLWTFRRELGDPNPNWMLVETRSA